MTTELDATAPEAAAIPQPPPLPPPAAPIVSAHNDARQWAMFIHLSQLLGWLVPLAGLVVPIVLWQVKKNDLPELDAHGKVVANWILSSVIYGVIFALFSIVLIGIPFLLALILASLILPVIGALKANDGEVMRYPLAIPIFR